MRFLVRLLPLDGSRDDLVRSLRTIAKTTGVEAKNPKWTSKGSLEMDIFASSHADFQTFVATTEPAFPFEFTRDLNEPPKHLTENELFDEGRRYFNGERYWESHEVFEGAWRTVSGPEKTYLQGIILVCAAFVHHQKGEDGVAIGVLARALKQLDYHSPLFHGIDVSLLKSNAEEVYRTGAFEPFQV